MTDAGTLLGAATWVGTVNEDGSYSVLARVVSLDGSGAEAAPGEGNLLQQADVSTITLKVFDLGTNKDATTGTEVTPTPTLTPAANVFDTVRTAGWPTPSDPPGYNFRHDVSPAYAPSPGEWYQLEYKFTLTTGGVLWLRVKVKTVGVITS